VCSAALIFAMSAASSRIEPLPPRPVTDGLKRLNGRTPQAGQPIDHHVAGSITDGFEHRGKAGRPRTPRYDRDRRKPSDRTPTREPPLDPARTIVSRAPTPASRPAPSPDRSGPRPSL
jgi:hypothetical protein